MFSFWEFRINLGGYELDPLFIYAALTGDNNDFYPVDFQETGDTMNWNEQRRKIQ